MSIDFTIPAGLEPAVSESGEPDTPRPPRYYVPLSFVRRWPPLSRLDLRDSTGRSIPFLTGRQNAILDSVALQQLALNSASEIAPELQNRIAEVAVLPDYQGRLEALDHVTTRPVPTDLSSAADAHRRLCDSPVFCGFAHALVANSLLWLRVEGWPEDREVVKFSYDMPLGPYQIEPWSKAAFGLEPFLFEFDVPHLGATSSYHCNVVAPPPLEVVRTGLALYEPADDGDRSNFASQVRFGVESTRARPQSDSLDLYTGVAESQAKFYASGDRTGLQGKIWIGLLIQNQGLLGGALGAGLISLGILLAFTVFLCSTVKLPEAAVAVLLVSPAVLGYLLVRPSEHTLVGGFLVALRRVVIASGVPPILAAVVVALSQGDDSLGIYLALGALTAIQAVLVGLIFVAHRAGRTWRERLKPHADASLLDSQVV